MLIVSINSSRFPTCISRSKKKSGARVWRSKIRRKKSSKNVVDKSWQALGLLNPTRDEKTLARTGVSITKAPVTTNRAVQGNVTSHTANSKINFKRKNLATLKWYATQQVNRARPRDPPLGGLLIVILKMPKVGNDREISNINNLSNPKRGTVFTELLKGSNIGVLGKGDLAKIGTLYGQHRRSFTRLWST